MREQVAGDWYAERGAHRVSKKRQANGEKLILWTSRNEEQTKEAVEWWFTQKRVYHRDPF